MMTGHPLLIGLLRCLCSTVVMSLVIYSIMTESSCPYRNVTGRNPGCRCLYANSLHILDRLLYTYLYRSFRADEVMGRSWQLIVAIHDDHDGLTLL